MKYKSPSYARQNVPFLLHNLAIGVVLVMLHVFETPISKDQVNPMLLCVDLDALKSSITINH